VRRWSRPCGSTRRRSGSRRIAPCPLLRRLSDDFQVSDDDVPFGVLLPFLAGLTGIGAFLA
jgi:hypothetical protein